MSNLDELYPHLGAHALAAEKEIKVRIPMDQHIKLHTIKVLHGQSISTTVKVALSNYFRDFEAERAAMHPPRRLETWGAVPLASDPSTPP